MTPGLANLIGVVDDDVSVRRSLRRLLEAQGFLVTTFASGPELLEYPNPSALACLVLDVRMPDMTGLDIQRHLAAQGVQTPIVFISGHDDPKVQEQAMRAGAAGFLRKPFDEAELVGCIERAIGQHR